MNHKIYSLLAWFLLLGAGGNAAQAGTRSLVAGGGLTGQFTVPKSAPYTGVSSFRFEIRVHGVVTPTSGCAEIQTIEVFRVNLCAPGALEADSVIQVQDFVDTFTDSNFYVLVPVTGRTDFQLRFQRDTVGKLISLEVWNIDGSGYALDVSRIGIVNPLPLPQQGNVGSATAQVQLAFVRWYGSVIPFGTALDLAPPPQPQAGGDLADWEFEGNGNDGSGRGQNLAYSGGVATYSNTPLYSPTCLAGSQRSFRAGTPNQLDGSMSYALDGGTALTYMWQQMPGVSPLQVRWKTSQTSAQPVIEGMVFGSYDFQLTVKDSSGNSSTCTIHDGAVATDAKGVVVVSNPKVDGILGPQIRFGANPWPYFDDRNKLLADYFGGLQARNPAVWNTELAGSISVSNGSAVVTGVGTSFLSSFACNGTDYIVLNYPHTPPGGVTNFYKVRSGVVSCASNTQLTLDLPWPKPTISNQQYAKMTLDQVFYWFGNATNANFYDVVLGFYSLYYRTGIDTYLQYARTLADAIWTGDQINRGDICDGTGQSPCPFPRNRSMTGLMLRALDGRDDMWPGLREVMNRNISSTLPIYNAQPLIFDLREYAYLVNEVALCSLLDPDSGQRSTCQSALVDTIHTVWTPQETSLGSWLNATLGAASWNGFPGTVTVTNLSTTVTGTGTNFMSGCAGQQFWSKQGVSLPLPNSEGDPISYRVVSVNSDTSLTISPPYKGESASGRGWQCDNLVGVGVQPFMLGGVAGRTFADVSRALADSYPTEAAKARNFAKDAWQWMATYGYWPETHGLFYGRTFPGCEPDPRKNLFCSTSDPAQTEESNIQVARFLAAETMNGCAQSYLISPSLTLQATCDSLYAGLYGGQGGPGADSHYAWQLLGQWGTSFTAQFSIAKNFGFGFGWGGGAAWPAARLGGADSSSNRTGWVGFRLADVPGSTQYRVTVFDPSGVASTTVCSTSPCAVSVDARLGDHVYQSEYLNAGNQVVARSELMMLQVR